MALASALANGPKLLLLDEPFGGLDAITRRELQEFYVEHVSDKVTAVFVTHDQDEALRIGDIIRIGVGPEAAVVPINRNGMSPSEWEKTEDFHRLRDKLVDDLQALGKSEAQVTHWGPLRPN